MTSPLPFDLAPLLRGILDEFDSSPPIAARRLRDLLRAGPAAFAEAAVEALRGGKDSAGVRFLANLLAGQGLLMRCLCDRAASLEEAVGLARAAARTVHQFDVMIARELSESVGSGKLDDAAVTRLLAVLEAVMEGSRAALLLNRLLAHPNPRIRSKAALMIGRVSGNGQWAERQLSSPDARVRANAVEALWHGTPETCLPLFRKAVADPNCRVAGNAALGFYVLGDPYGVGALMELCGHPAAAFRATAAWCMGETRDPRFLPVLQRMLRENEGKVRQNVLRAMSRLRQALANCRAAGDLRVEVASVEELPGNLRRLRVAVADGECKDPAPLRQTCFAVAEDGRAVVDYAVTELPPADAQLVGFAVPRRVDAKDPLGGLIESAVADSARCRRKSDSWGLLQYAVEEWGPLPDSEDAPIFSADPGLVLRAAAASGGAQTALWTTVGRLLRAAMLVRSSRHLVIVGDPDRPIPHLDDGELGSLLATAAASRTAVHAVWNGSGTDSALERLTSRTGGRLVPVRGIEEIPRACSGLALSLLARYEVVYRTEGALDPSAQIAVSVHSDAGIGDCLWPAGSGGEETVCA